MVKEKNISLNKQKNKKGKIIAIILVVVIILSAGIGGLIYYFSNRYEESPYFAILCKNRVVNAQYLPDISKIAYTITEEPQEVAENLTMPLSLNKATESYSSSNLHDIDKTITLENFNEVIDKLGWIDNPFDREFTITDIKDEVYNVLSNVSVFDRWVNYEGGGGTGDYYIEYNEESQHISVKRISYFAGDYYDPITESIVSSSNTIVHEDDKNQIGLDIAYKIDYYYNEKGVEVVECEIINLLNIYGNHYITQYQYVKNVKDTSFTKYIIKMNDERLELPNGRESFDITTDNELGYTREFIQMDYKNSNDISLLFVNQFNSTAFNLIQDTTRIKFYRKINNEISLYNSVYVFGEETSFGPLKYFIRDSYDDVFSFYIEEYGTVADIDFLVHGNTENYHSDYKSFSTDTIETLYRELYYTDGVNYLSTTPGSYYEKANEDNANCYYGLQNISLHINNSLTSLAINTQMSQNNINSILNQSPTHLDIADTNGNYSYETFVELYLNKIAKNAIDNSFLAQNLKNYREQAKNTLVVDPNNITGQSDYINLKSFESFASIKDKVITYSANAQISQSILLKNGGPYKLCLVAKGTANSFKVLQEGNLVKYSDSDMSLNISNTFDLNNLNLTLTDEYKIGIALLFDNVGSLSICSTTQYLSFNNDSNIVIEKTSNNGFETEYEFNFLQGNLIVTATVKDIQNPTIECENNMSFESGATIKDFIKNISILDNDKIVKVVVIKDLANIYDYNTALEEGSYTISVCDANGNTATANINVVIV